LGKGVLGLQLNGFNAFHPSLWVICGGFDDGGYWDIPHAIWAISTISMGM
jgi:hypothetical protein